MYLKRVELSGFKSFAKTTILEFPAKITAVVGPNGSGKSNIKEAIQWVLGEQSMKSLRGKKGEDLIWNGSPVLPSGGPQVSRMGKASVTLVFDNRDNRIPLDFEEVVVSRKIFRDGINEYYLNDSQVRLKDLVELTARIGLGETKHNIIGQGEVDRVLLSSPRERREMLEEALGLRVYRLKKHEAELKFESTENNMKQVEALIREITPHLKFLSSQAKKAEARGDVEEELKNIRKVYFAKENREIEQEAIAAAERAKPFMRRHDEIKKEIARFVEVISKKEAVLILPEAESEEEKKVMRFEERRREIEREIGRLEGKIEVEREHVAQPQVRAPDARYIEEEIREFVAQMRSLVEEEDRIEVVRSHLLVLIEDLEHLLREISRGRVEEQHREPVESSFIKELEKTVLTLQKEREKIAKEIDVLISLRRESREKYRAAQSETRELDAAVRALQDEERGLALQRERFRFDEERIGLRRTVLARECAEASIDCASLQSLSLDGYDAIAVADIKKKIERLEVKLEEIGGIDQSVIKEYEETSNRHSFLTKELDDLKQAFSSLKELIKELDGHIRRDFKEGFTKIKDEFHNYFRIIFGGGKGTLQLVDIPVRGGSSDDEEEGVDPVRSHIPEASAVSQAERTSNGVDISVELPRKRIKGLAMLSGGERALTSIALLFAIIAVNPPPFLILDETDAALDEANSQRYATILKELAKRTQLILVTHNRETMKSANVLYGVTMGEDGVSKLLSLKFEEAEEFTNR